MRGRFSKLFDLQNHNKFRKIAGAAAMVGTGFAYYSTQHPKHDDSVNVKLDNVQKMEAYAANLKAAFARANPDDQVACKNFKGLLRAIERNVIDSADDMIKWLKDGNAVITADILDGLIAYTANHSKINVLELLQKAFGSEVVLRNHHARKLLSYSQEERETLTHYLEEFYQSPGEIELDGMEMCVAILEEEILQRHLEHRAYQPVYVTMDLADDIHEGYKQVRSEQEITRELKQRFKQTIIIDQCLDFESSKSSMESFMVDLRELAIGSKQPVIGTIVLASGHYMLAQIEVTHLAKTGETNAALVFVDPLGAYANLQRTYLYPYMSIPHRVFSNVELFCSEEKLQFRDLGCSLFVCDLFNIAHDLTQILEHNYQHDNIHSLFDYSRRYKTSTHDYALSEDLNNEIYNRTNTFHLFPLPPAMIISKQSMTNDGFHYNGSNPDSSHYEEQVFKQTSDGKFTVEVVNKEPQKRLGVMGLHEAEHKSPRDRQREFDGPADVGCTKTVKEIIESNIVPNKANKPQNKRIDYSAYLQGVFFSNRSDRVLAHAKEREKKAQGISSNMTTAKKHH